MRGLVCFFFEGSSADPGTGGPPHSSLLDFRDCTSTTSRGFRSGDFRRSGGVIPVSRPRTSSDANHREEVRAASRSCLEAKYKQKHQPICQIELKYIKMAIAENTMKYFLS